MGSVGGGPYGEDSDRELAERGLWDDAAHITRPDLQNLRETIERQLSRMSIFLYRENLQESDGEMPLFPLGHNRLAR
jgi:hypothetical protein